MPGPIRVAIVEDEARDSEHLRRDFLRYQKETGTAFELTEFRDGEDLMTDYAPEYDLIVMDIEMAFMDGMEAARRVRALDPDVVIVFITNAPQYAIEGYKVHAADYLVKPVQFRVFSESLTRALRFIRPREKPFLTLALREGKKRLNRDELYYVEVRDHQLIYVAREGRYVVKGAMKDVETSLPQDAFFRCNRCYLVNLKYVEAWHGNDLVVAGDTLQISRRQRKPFLDALNRYLARKI